MKYNGKQYKNRATEILYGIITNEIYKEREKNKHSCCFVWIVYTVHIIILNVGCSSFQDDRKGFCVQQ